MEIKKAVERINSLFRFGAFAVRTVGTDFIVAIFCYKSDAKKWIESRDTFGMLEIIKIDLAGCDLVLNIKH